MTTDDSSDQSNCDDYGCDWKYVDCDVCGSPECYSVCENCGDEERECEASDD